ncbi:MAG: hypothetical protein U0795_12060 [Pirellulales bacterium]
MSGFEDPLEGLPDEYGFRARMAAATDQELVDYLNREVGNPGIVRARMYFLLELRAEFLRRRIDISEIAGPYHISVARRVVLTADRCLMPIGDRASR